VSLYREKPVIYKKRAPDTPPKQGNYSMSCFGTVLFLLIGYVILHAFAAVNSGKANGLETVICWATPAGFLVLALFVYVDEIPIRKAKAIERESWIKTCTVDQVKILKRHEGGVYDDGDRFHSFHCRLELEMNADQRAAAPNETVVSAEISDSIYRNLEKRDTVRIYYWTEAPLTFSIEEELKYL